MVERTAQFRVQAGKHHNKMRVRGNDKHLDVSRWILSYMSELNGSRTSCLHDVVGKLRFIAVNKLESRVRLHSAVENSVVILIGDKNLVLSIKLIIISGVSCEVGVPMYLTCRDSFLFLFRKIQKSSQDLITLMLNSNGYVNGFCSSRFGYFRISRCHYG